MKDLEPWSDERKEQDRLDEEFERSWDFNMISYQQYLFELQGE